MSTNTGRNIKYKVKMKTVFSKLYRQVKLHTINQVTISKKY